MINMSHKEIRELFESQGFMIGYSVTQRIKMIKQPRGGYINPNNMILDKMNDDFGELNLEENVHTSLVGTVVDYLTRFILNKSVSKSFQISLMGAKFANKVDIANELLKQIKGLDNTSIISATKLVGFDVCFRAGMEYYRPVEEINPSNETIENIKIMVKRSLAFFDKYGPVIKEGITFEGGYTDLVSAGDGDFITEDTL